MTLESQTLGQDTIPEGHRMVIDPAVPQAPKGPKWAQTAVKALGWLAEKSPSLGAPRWVAALASAIAGFLATLFLASCTTVSISRTAKDPQTGEVVTSSVEIVKPVAILGSSDTDVSGEYDPATGKLLVKWVAHSDSAALQALLQAVAPIVAQAASQPAR